MRLLALLVVLAAAAALLWALSVASGPHAPEDEPLDRISAIPEFPSGPGRLREACGSVGPHVGVHGQVLDAAEFPVSGMTIVAVLADPIRESGPRGRLRRTPRPEAEYRETDREGRFAFDSLPRGARYRFEARRDGRRQGMSGPHLLLPGDPDGILIRLPPRRLLEVRVRDQGTAQAVPGARVELLRRVRERLAPEPGAAWTTGADGSIRIDLEPEGRAWLRVTHPRYVNTGTVHDLPTESQRVVVALDPGLSIAGRVVLSEGESVIEGRVSVESVSFLRHHLDGRFGTDVKVGRDGRFLLEGVPAGTYRLVADVRAGKRSLWGVTTVAAGSEPLRLELDEVPTEPVRNELVVLVTGPGGEPVPGFCGILWPPVKSHRLTPDGKGWTFSNGTMAVPAPESSPDDGKRWLLVWLAGDAEGRPLPFAAAVHGPLADGAREVSVRLEPERTVAGTVRSKDGQAIAGVRIVARGYAPEILSRGRPLRLRPLGEAWTDSEGAFRVGGLRPGEVDLEVIPPAPYRAPPNVRTAADDEDVAVVCEVGETVLVTVVDGEGRPVVDAWVTAGGRGAGTDVRGRARLTGLDPKRTYDLHASSATPPRGTVCEARWTPGPTTLVLRDPGSVEILLRMPDGHPAPNARVRVRAGESAWREVEPSGPEARVLVPCLSVLQATSVFGHFADPDLPMIELSKDDTRRVVVVDPGRALAFVVADRSATETVRANLVILRAGSRHAREVYGPGGQVRVEGLRVGDHVTAWIRSAGGEACWMGHGLRPGESVRRIRLSPGRTVRGRLLLPSEARGVGVSLAELDVPASVNAEGRFAFHGVSADRLHLRATAVVSGQVRARRVEITGRDEVEIDLRER